MTDAPGSEPWQRLLRALLEIAYEDLAAASRYETQQLRDAAVLLGLDPMAYTPYEWRWAYCPGHQFTSSYGQQVCVTCGESKRNIQLRQRQARWWWIAHCPDCGTQTFPTEEARDQWQADHATQHPDHDAVELAKVFRKWEVPDDIA